MKSSREYYGQKIREEIFGTEARPTSLKYIEDRTHISKSTLSNWKKDPGKMPAHRYLQLKDLLGG